MVLRVPQIDLDEEAYKVENGEARFAKEAVCNLSVEEKFFEELQCQLNAYDPANLHRRYRLPRNEVLQAIGKDLVFPKRQYGKDFLPLRIVEFDVPRELIVSLHHRIVNILNGCNVPTTDLIFLIRKALFCALNRLI